MGVFVRRCIDILTIIINFPYSTCISSFFGSSIPTSMFINVFRSCLYYFCTIYIANVTQRIFDSSKRNRDHANIIISLLSIIKNVKLASTTRARESRDFNVQGTE